MKRAKIVGFVSIKGGVGKTTTVSNLGLILAKTFKKKILIVDA
ncbi:MAG: ParA family protein, partial [Nanoarchaeota archaeon]